MIRLAVLAVSGLLSVTASASNWVHVSQNLRVDAYVDTDSIVSTNNYIKAFIKFETSEVQVLSTVNEKYDTLVGLREFNCNPPAQIRTLSATARLNGIVTASEPTSWYSAWSYVEPDTLDEAITNFVCSY